MLLIPRWLASTPFKSRVPCTSISSSTVPSSNHPQYDYNNVRLRKYLYLGHSGIFPPSQGLVEDVLAPLQNLPEELSYSSAPNHKLLECVFILIESAWTTVAHWAAMSCRFVDALTYRDPSMEWVQLGIDLKFNADFAYMYTSGWCIKELYVSTWISLRLAAQLGGSSMISNSVTHDTNTLCYTYMLAWCCFTRGLLLKSAKTRSDVAARGSRAFTNN